jgi:hypothetical protein
MLTEPEGVASRGRPLPFGRMPGVSAATWYLDRTDDRVLRPLNQTG